MFQLLYKDGARFFWVHNTGPIGCLPYSILYNKSPNNRDPNGCVKSQNEVSREFNQQLKNLLLELGKKLPLARFINVNMYSAKYLLISKAKTQGQFRFSRYIDSKCESIRGTNFSIGIGGRFC